MIAHLVTLRWKDGTTDEQIAEVTEALGALPAQIDVLRSYVAQPALPVRPNADFGVLAIVERPEDVSTYLDHPAHQAVVQQLIAPIVAERAAVQLPFVAPA